MGMKSAQDPGFQISALIAGPSSRHNCLVPYVKPYRADRRLDHAFDPIHGPSEYVRRKGDGFICPTAHCFSFVLVVKNLKRFNCCAVLILGQRYLFILQIEKQTVCRRRPVHKK